MTARASWSRYILRIVAGAAVFIPAAGLIWLRAGAPENQTLRGAILAMIEGIALVVLAAGLNLKETRSRRLQRPRL